MVYVATIKILNGNPFVPAGHFSGTIMWCRSGPKSLP
jgi:hypothetical protein